MLRALIYRGYHLSTTVPLLRDFSLGLRRLYRRISGKPPLAVGADGLAAGGLPRFGDYAKSLERHALIERVRVLIARGDAAGAIAYLRGTALDDHERAQILRDLGSDFHRAGAVDRCIDCRRAAVVFTPKNWIAHLELLRTLYREGRQREAFDHAAGVDLSIEGVARHDFTAEEKVIYSLISDVAIASPELVATLVRATDYVLRERIPGAFVECGVFRGGSTMVTMMASLFRGSRDRAFFLYDTFTGFPWPDEIDVYHADGRPARDEWQEKQTADGKSGWLVSSLEQTRANVESVGYPKELTHYVQGMVEDTIPGEAPAQIAFLRLDTDFYVSTKHELEHLFPRLSPRGVLIIDDYGAFKGAQQAVDEYLRENHLPYLLHRVDSNVRIVVKA